MQDHTEVSGSIKTSISKIKTSLSHRVAFEKGCIEMDIEKVQPQLELQIQVQEQVQVHLEISGSIKTSI